MIPSRYIVAIVLFTCFVVTGWSQQTYKSCYGFDCKEAKWRLSFFTGYSLLGPSDDIKRQFVESGFDDSPLREGLSDPVLTKKHPRAQAGLIWNIETQYLLSPKSSLGITLGTINHQSVTGYDSIGDGNFLKLSIKTYTGSIKYSFRLRQSKDDLSFGPVLASMRLQNDASYHEGINWSPMKAGFCVGYSFSVLQKKSWFIGLKTNYTWLPSAKIGPYTKEHKTTINQETINVYSSVYEQTDVRLSSFYIGLSAGWKW